MIELHFTRKKEKLKSGAAIELTALQHANAPQYPPGSGFYRNALGIQSTLAKSAPK